MQGVNRMIYFYLKKVSEFALRLNTASHKGVRGHSRVEYHGAIAIELSHYPIVL